MAGRPLGAMADLIDDHVAVGDDVVEFLRRTRRALGIIDRTAAERR